MPGLSFHAIGSEEKTEPGSARSGSVGRTEGLFRGLEQRRRPAKRGYRFHSRSGPDDGNGGHSHPLVVPGASMARELDTAPANLRTCHDPLIMGPLHVPRWIPMSWRRWLWRRVDADMLDPVTVPGIDAARRT